jgi:hypothetical protein
MIYSCYQLIFCDVFLLAAFDDLHIVSLVEEGPVT